MKLIDEVKETCEQISLTQEIISNNSLDKETFNSCCKTIYDLKRKLKKLEKDNYLNREPDIKGDILDLYIKNLRTVTEKDPEKVSYYITLHDSKELVGTMNIRFKLEKEDLYLGNIGTTLEEEHKGKRYSKEAFLLARDVMLERGLRKPIFTVYKDNIPLIKSLENMEAVKIGEGINKDSEFLIYEYDLEKPKNVK